MGRNSPVHYYQHGGRVANTLVIVLSALSPTSCCWARVFNRAMAAHFDATMKHKYFRCKNNNDIVPRIPTPPGFKHVGTEIYFDRL